MIRKIFKKPLRSLLPNRLRSRLGLNLKHQLTYFSKKRDISQRLRKKYDYEGDLVQLALKNKNILVKYDHYFPIYEKYFSKFRGKKVNILEIITLSGCIINPKV